MYYSDLTLNLLLSATTINLAPIEQPIYLDGDYSIEAHEYMLQHKPYEFFDSNDLLYKIIIEELEKDF
jgi:hypothetical protein